MMMIRALVAALCATAAALQSPMRQPLAGSRFASGRALVGSSTPARRHASSRKHLAPLAPRRPTTLAAATTDDDDGDVKRTLALLLAAQFVLFVGVGAVIPVIPIFAKAIGLSSAASGVVISAPAVALLLLARPAGVVADRARKPAMIGGMLAIAVADLGTACAAGLWTLVAARVGLGAGRCFSESAERGMLADLGDKAPSFRGRALAAQQAAAAVGIAVGAPVGGLVVEAYGERAAFLCVTAAAVATAALYGFLPETAGGAARDDAAPSEAAWPLLLEDPRWRGLAAAECGARFGFAAKIASVPVVAADVLPGGVAGAGALVSAAGLAGLVGAPAGGFLADRFGARATAVGAGGAAGAALAATPAALALDDPAAPFSLLIVLWSACVAAQGPAAQATAQRLAPRGGEAEALALPRAAGDAVYIVAPVCLGLVADARIAPGAELALAGAATALGAAALGALRGEDPAR